MKRLHMDQTTLDEMQAKQDKLMKLPNLAERQQQALDARAQERFGTSLTCIEEFKELKPDTVFPILMRYTNGHMPKAPTLRDIGRGFGGGYAQLHLTLMLVRMVDKVGRDGVEVQFETPTCLSYKNGPRCPDDRFMLVKDGSIRYFETDGWRQWTHFVPRWEPAQFPQLEVVCSGFV